MGSGETIETADRIRKMNFQEPSKSEISNPVDLIDRAQIVPTESDPSSGTVRNLADIVRELHVQIDRVSMHEREYALLQDAARQLISRNVELTELAKESALRLREQMNRWGYLVRSNLHALSLFEEYGKNYNDMVKKFRAEASAYFMTYGLTVSYFSIESDCAQQVVKKFQRDLSDLKTRTIEDDSTRHASTSNETSSSEQAELPGNALPGQ